MFLRVFASKGRCTVQCRCKARHTRELVQVQYLADAQSLGGPCKNGWTDSQFGGILVLADITDPRWEGALSH